MKVNDYTIRPALLVIDVQNGFGQKVVLTTNWVSIFQSISMLFQRLQNLLVYVETQRFLFFIPKSIREPSGIDLLTNVHRILPKSREERIRMKPICVRGTLGCGDRG